MRRVEHDSHLVDKDPVPPLITGTVLLGVLAALAIFATGWLPWGVGLIAAVVGWASLAYGIVITAAKVDDIREVLRAQMPSSSTSGESDDDVE